MKEDDSNEDPFSSDIKSNTPIDSSQSSFYQEHSTFLKNRKTTHAHTRIRFNFLNTSPMSEIRTFLITIIRKKFPNIFYAFDSTSFCLLRSERDLKRNQRYLIYGKLSKNKFFFLESLKEEEINYKELCYMIV